MAHLFYGNRGLEFGKFEAPKRVGGLALHAQDPKNCRKIRFGMLRASKSASGAPKAANNHAKPSGFLSLGKRDFICEMDFPCCGGFCKGCF
jgi:hypothetical protein